MIKSRPRTPVEPYMMRHTDELRYEALTSEGFFYWLYNSELGRRVRPFLMQSKLLHRLVGRFAYSKASRHLIPWFIKKAAVDSAEIELPVFTFSSFNEFFTRRLKVQARPIDNDPRTLICPGDGKLLVFEEIHSDLILPIKGVQVVLKELLNNSGGAERYGGGSACVLRLYLSDYHRIHFPAEGVPQSPFLIEGDYNSLSPIPGNDVNFYCRNKRTITYFDTTRFGRMALIDIGGFLISSIQHNFTAGLQVKKGDEKSAFQFGGSTLVILCEKKTVRFHDDLLHNSRQGIETYVQLGEAIGEAL